MNILKKIDNYFYTHTTKDLIYAIMGSAVLLGFLFFYFLYPNALNFKKTKEKKYNDLINVYNQTQIELNAFKIRKIKLENNLKISNAKLITLKKQESFYTELTNLLDFAQFNKQKWANYVKNLIFDARNEGLNVKAIKNNIFDTNTTILKNLPQKLIVKKMSIGIKLSGNYKNFIHYMYKYENTKDLLRVEEIKIDPKKNYYVKFLLYGYEK